MGLKCENCGKDACGGRNSCCMTPTCYNCFDKLTAGLRKFEDIHVKDSPVIGKKAIGFNHTRGKDWGYMYVREVNQ